MNFLKIIGLFCLFCFTFIYTEKIITISMEQDEIMLTIKEKSKLLNTNPINAKIESDTIIPGQVGKYIDEEKSYKSMKKIGYYEENLITYKNIYPEISIYNNFNKYIIKGNTKNKEVSLIYILNNQFTLDNIINVISKTNTKINFFIDSNFLINNISIINKIKDNEIYNYGSNGTYTKDNLIVTNNIINNKSNNNSNICLFIKKESKSLSNCTNLKMFSIIPSLNKPYAGIINNLENGSIILINNTKELESIIEYITNKGYQIVPLSKLITE